MKNLFKNILYVSVIALLAISCDENETTYDALNYPKDAFVALETGDVNVLENTTEPIEIVVNYSNSKEGATSAVTANFSITSSNAIEGIHYTIQDNKSELNFPVGTFSDTVVIIPIDNSEEDGDKILNFTLDSATSNLGYPGPDAFGTSIVVTLTDNDCAFTLADLDGIAWIGTDNSGSQGPNETQIETTFDGTTLFMEGIAYGWLTGSYWNEPVVVSHLVEVDMDPVSGVFTVAYQELCETTYLGVPQTPYQISATGQYFSCITAIVLDYTLYQGGAVLREYTETIEY